MVLIHKFVIL